MKGIREVRRLSRIERGVADNQRSLRKNTGDKIMSRGTNQKFKFTSSSGLMRMRFWSTRFEKSQ